jgi:PPOX class probable FMN-dependent enzyme
MNKMTPNASCEALAQLKTALRKNRRDAHHRYFQMATVAAEGHPKNRTVVFRGFGVDDVSLLVITDLRSEKIVELKQNASVEVAWYFTRTREQFRISAVTTCVDYRCQAEEDSALREQVWQQLSEAARAQFFWRSPGRPVDTGVAAAITDAPPETFALLKLNPVAIDHLVLSKVQTRRRSQLKDGHWYEHWVNP